MATCKHQTSDNQHKLHPYKKLLHSTRVLLDSYFWEYYNLNLGRFTFKAYLIISPQQKSPKAKNIAIIIQFQYYHIMCRKRLVAEMPLK